MARIFLAEDEPHILEMVTELLSGRGHTVSSVSNGKDALSLLLENPPQQLPELIILDIMMPGVNGIDLSKKLAADKQFSRIPVIFLSGKIKSSTILEAGPNVVGIVEKPVFTKKLLSLIDTLLQSQPNSN